MTLIYRILGYQLLPVDANNPLDLQLSEATSSHPNAPVQALCATTKNLLFF